MPAIGIFTDHPFPLPRSYAYFCTFAARQGFQAYFFLPGSVDWKSGRIWAILWQKGRWTRSWVPLPALVYNQIQYLHIANSHFSVRDVNGFQQRSIPVIHLPFLDRWRVHQALKEERSLHSHLPATALWDYRRNSLEEWLMRYPVLFVKLCRSSHSRGIFQLCRRKGWYEIKGFNRSGRLYAAIHPTIDRVQADLHRLMAKELCLLQQGISIEERQGYRSDVRYLLQKKSDKNWEVIAAYRKIAPPKHVVTGLASGARRIFLSPADQDVRDLTLARTAAHHLSRNNDSLCEIAFDIGYDSQRHPYFLEVDTHYCRNILPRAIRLTSMENPLNYAFSLLTSRQAQ